MVKRVNLWIISVLFVMGCASMGKAWEMAEDKKDGTRFIPIALWSGQKWRGKEDLNMPQVNFKFGRRNHKSIKGPVKWQHPITRQHLNVYERINETTKGTKRQLYTLNPDGTGLSKVFDRRPNQEVRYQSDNAVLFPLGLWRKGERRHYVFYAFVDGKKLRRKVTLRMRRLSFTYKGVKHAMKYDWMMTDERGKLLFHERYIYAPERSLMYYKDRLKKK